MSDSPRMASSRQAPGWMVPVLVTAGLVAGLLVGAVGGFAAATAAHLWPAHRFGIDGPGILPGPGPEPRLEPRERPHRDERPGREPHRRQTVDTGSTAASADPPTATSRPTAAVVSG